MTDSSQPPPVGFVSELSDSHPRLVTMGSMAFAVLVQQFATSFWFAGRWMMIISGRVDVTHWEFWYFWNDYWIFAKYLDWPRRSGNAIAAEANLAGAVFVAVGFALWWWFQ